MNSSIEVYVIILVIGLVSVVMWEAAKAAMRRVNPAAQTSSFGFVVKDPLDYQASKMTRAECNELSG